jgi:uncharacterized Rmd1/YagE family protein
VGNDRARDVLARLGAQFEARAIHIGEHIDIRGVEPRLGPQLPVMIEVAPAGCAALLRAGVAVVFGVDAIQQDRFLSDLGPRVSDRYPTHELERAIVRVGDADSVEPDALVVKEVTLERLQVIAEILAKSVILARHEREIAEVFQVIEPMAVQMSSTPERLPWRQRDLVKHIGNAMLVQHQLVGSAEVLEKPDLLWDHPELDRFYARLGDEYEIRERHLALERKLTVVASSAQTMLDLAQARRSINVEYYIVGLIVLELMLAIYQLFAR